MTRDEEINQKARELALDWNVGRGNEFYYRFDKLVDIARWADRTQPNQWISVEDRLPPRDVALVFPTHSIPVIGMIGNSTDAIHTGMRYDYSSKEWCYGFTPMRKYGADKDDLLIRGDTLPVTHWMPIPKLKKV